MNDSTDKDYWVAKEEAGLCAHNALNHTVATIDYLNRDVLGSAFSFHDYFGAYRGRLSEKASLADRITFHNLAYIQHDFQLHERIAVIFDNLATSITASGNLDPYLAREIEAARGEISETRTAIALFAEPYKSEITAETTTDEYAADRKIIAETIDELEQVTKLGKWTPEYVVVTDSITNMSRRLETPTSQEMGRIALMSPQIRALGFVLSKS